MMFKMEEFVERRQNRFLRLRDVMYRVGLSRSMINKLIRNGEFPKPLRLGGRAVGWLEADITRHQEQVMKRSRGA